MVEKDAAAFLGNIVGHSVEELAINKKLDTASGPVKAVLVKLFVWAEWKVLDYEAVCSLGSETVGDGLRALENQVYSALRCIELMREEFHVDFLRVVVVLRTISQGTLFARGASWWRTKKNAPQVPDELDNFMPTRKVPSSESLRMLTISALLT